MRVTPIKTDKIVPDSGSLFDVLDKAFPSIEENSVIVITSKIVSICEGNVVPFDGVDKEELIIEEADQYLPKELSKYGYHFTVTDNTLISLAGIDESNSNDHYILWPKDSQNTANDVREYLSEKHQLKNVGVVIADSTSQPLRRGTIGISLAHSGFMSLNDYVGQPDLFGRPFGVTKANIAGGLAGAAVLVMGEGTEQTPICVITDVPFVQFVQYNPSAEELAEITISIEDDLFAPFLTAVQWQKGKRGSRS